MFTRVCSLVLAGLLATSTYVAVATESPVSATWEPQPQSTDGVRQAGLSLALSDTSSAVAAMVEIHLDENEAAALQWDGSTIPVGELKPAGPEESEGTSSGESSESSSGFMVRPAAWMVTGLRKLTLPAVASAVTVS